MGITKMKLLRSVVASLAFLCLTGVTGAFAQTTLTAVIINNSTYTLNGVYASASDGGNWQISPTYNLINGQVIQPGQSVTVNIPNTSGTCSYDLLGELFGSNQYDYDYSLNACNGDTWTISSSS